MNLYGDKDESIISLLRPQLINGIDNITSRQDFVSRAVVLQTPMLCAEQYKSTAKIFESFEQDRSAIFKGIIELLSHVLQHLDDWPTTSGARMAEYMTIGQIITEHYGLGAQYFVSPSTF